MTFTPHHVALSVRNIEESVAWYETHLGFVSVCEKYEKAGLYFMLIEQNGFHIELIQPIENGEALPTYRHKNITDLMVVGTKHLCLETADIEEAVSTLRSNGVAIASEISCVGFGGQKAFIQDCNGILIELYQGIKSN